MDPRGELLFSWHGGPAVRQEELAAMPHGRGRLIWSRNEKSVKVSLTLQERGKGRNKEKKRKRLVGIVVAKWKFIGREERFRDETIAEEAYELLTNWDFESLIGFAGLRFDEDDKPEAKVEEKLFCPYVPYIRDMAEESLRQIS